MSHLVWKRCILVSKNKKIIFLFLNRCLIQEKSQLIGLIVNGLIHRCLYQGSLQRHIASYDCFPHCEPVGLTLGKIEWFISKLAEPRILNKLTFTNKSDLSFVVSLEIYILHIGGYFQHLCFFEKSLKVELLADQSWPIHVMIEIKGRIPNVTSMEQIGQNYLC